MNKQDALRASLCGRAALSVQTAAETLYQAGGKNLLSEGTRQGLRHALGEFSQRASVTSTQVLDSARVLAAAVDSTPFPTATAVRAGRSVALHAGRAAVGEIAKGAGRAAGLAFLVDGAFGAGRAVQRYRRGEYTRQQAYAHVVKEASTGAAASAAGIIAASAAIALTGGLAAPIVMGIAASSAVLTKMSLRRFVGE